MCGLWARQQGVGELKLGARALKQHPKPAVQPHPAKNRSRGPAITHLEQLPGQLQQEGVHPLGALGHEGLLDVGGPRGVPQEVRHLGVGGRLMSVRLGWGLECLGGGVLGSGWVWTGDSAA